MRNIVKSAVSQIFDHDLSTPAGLRRARIYTMLVDVGFLRIKWTNEGVVDTGILRSNNPTEKRFAAYAARGIKTVLNLRNDQSRSPYKLAERACARHGMAFVNLPLSARKAPKKEQLLALVDLLPTLEKPVLMHCKSGADRTGLVAAIWQLTQNNAPLGQAQKELSLQYLHRRHSETGVLDQVLDLYAEAPDGQGFRDWVRETYDPEIATARAAAAPRPRGIFAQTRSIIADLHRYSLYREALWHKSYAGPIDTPQKAKRARFFINWIDHGILRHLWHNQSVVTPEILRSNHPSEARLRRLARDGLRTVVNLRGASELPTYVQEAALCRALDLRLIDLPMNAKVAPPAQTLIDLIDILETAQKPLLIHCKSGADRTGIAAAIWQLHQGYSVDAAAKQLSLRFIHLKGGAKGVLDAVIAAYAADNAQDPITLRDWLLTRYDAPAITAAFKAARER